MRREGWEKRFSEYIMETRKIDFIWGTNDCVLFAIKAFEKITGKNIYQQYIGYTDEQGAKEIIIEAGSLEKLVSRHLGQTHKNFLKAKRGDVVLLRLPQFCLGIVDDSGQKIIAISEKGWVRLPLNKAYRIWSY